MKPSYQLKEAQLIKAVTHVNGTTDSAAKTTRRMMASDESCDRYKETLVSQLRRQQHQHSVEEKGDKSRFCARNELLNALACLDELEKSITSVHHIPPKISSTPTTAVGCIDSDQLKYLKANSDAEKKRRGNLD